MNTSKTSRGSAPIYIALFFGILITSAAIALGATLTRQLKASQDIIATERAFSAGNAGVEAVLLELRRDFEEGVTDEVAEISGAISYEDGTQATYEARGAFVLNQNQTNLFPCVKGTGLYQESERQIQFSGAEDCEL